MPRIVSLPRRFYDYVIKHPIIAWGALSIPSAGLAVIRSEGAQFGFLNTDGTMTTLGHWVFWILLAVSIIYPLLKSYADHYNERAKNNGQIVLREMLDSINAVTKKKKKRFADYINENKDKAEKTPFNEITQPILQIECILENLQSVLSKIFGISRDQIGVTVAYKFDAEAEWKWLATVNVDHNGLSLNDLIGNKESTVYHLLHTNANTIFYEDKKIGKKERHYLESPKDTQFDSVGSIICRNVSLQECNHAVAAVLSVTTYGYQICSKGDIEAKQKIEELILDPFETRVRLELALLFIKMRLADKN